MKQVCVLAAQRSFGSCWEVQVQPNQFKVKGKTLENLLAPIQMFRVDRTQGKDL